MKNIPLIENISLIYIFISRFPLNNKPLLKHWIKALDLKHDNRYIVPTYDTLVCSAHFAQKDYVLEDGNIKLHSYAIPSKYGYKNNVKQDCIYILH